MDRKTFDNAEVLDEYIRKLQKYREESKLSEYSDDCFMQDVTFLLGVSIDENEYRMADGYRKFVMRYIRPFVITINEQTKKLFQRRLEI